jgi:hypothetical protein
MILTDIGASVVDRAKRKVEAVEAKGLSYVPQIIEAHKQVVAAERSGHQRSLDAAIAAGELLNAAKEAIKGQFRWSEWRSEYLKDVPQTTASLYMRLAKNQDRLRKPSGELTTGVAKLAATGELSVRKAASLLAEKKPRGKPPQPKRHGDEEIAKGRLRGLAPDELIAILRELHDMEWLREMVAAAMRVIDGAAATNIVPSSTGVFERRI